MIQPHDSCLLLFRFFATFIGQLVFVKSIEVLAALRLDLFDHAIRLQTGHQAPARALANVAGALNFGACFGAIAQREHDLIRRPAARAAPAEAVTRRAASGAHRRPAASF